MTVGKAKLRAFAVAVPSTRRILFHLVSVAVAAVFALVLAEGVLQLVDFPPRDFSPWVRDDHTAFAYARNLHTRMARPPEYDVVFETNALGLRDDEIGPKKGPRVLLLGDSFTSGYGVPRGEIFADLLENRLGVEVVNAGVGGYEIVHQVHFLRENGRRLAPDLVVYMLYLGNDLSRNEEWLEEDGNVLRARDREFPVRLPYQSKLWLLANASRYGLRADAARRRGEWEPFDDYLALCARELGPAAAASYERSEHLLLELAEEVDRIGAELVVFMFSYRTTVEPDVRARFREARGGASFDAQYDLDLPAARIGRFLAAHRIEYHDLDPALAQAARDGKGPLYFAIDGHFTAAGHLVVAAETHAVLASRLPGDSRAAAP